jgi:hypothetical protein
MISIPFLLHRHDGLGIAPQRVAEVGSALAVVILGLALVKRWGFRDLLPVALSAIVARWVISTAYEGLGPLPSSPRLATAIFMGLIGAVLSCVWLGWYFATALVFNGHANEAGSTARTEEYKHFIRFRLTKDTLTGYVIAVDFPHAPENNSKDEVAKKGGHMLKPRLVDVFTLRCNDEPREPWEVLEEELRDKRSTAAAG